MPTYYRNKRTGEILNSTQFNSRAKQDTPSPEEEGAIKQLKIASNVVKELKTAYQNAVGKEYEGPGAGPVARLKGIGRTAGRITGLDENQQIYRNLAESNLSIIARALKAEKGVLTEQDVSRARGALATAFSSPKEARALFDAIENQAKNNLKILYGTDTDTGDERTEKIRRLRSEAATAQSEADRGPQYLKQGVQDAARFALEAPGRFLASAAAAPIDLARTAMGGQPISGNIPILNKPTYQSQGAQDIAGQYDRIYAGESYTAKPSDYAEALKPFVQVPLAAAETAGIGKGLFGDKVLRGGNTAFTNRELTKGDTTKGLVDSTKRLFNKTKDKKAFEEALDVVRPQLTAKEEELAKASGRATTQGITRKVVIAPDRRSVEVADAAKGIVSKKKSFDQNINALRTEIAKTSEDDVLGMLKKNNAIFNEKQLRSRLNLAKEESRVVFGSDKTLESQYDAAIDEFVRQLKSRPKNVENLYQTRIDFDQLMKNKFGPDILNPARSKDVVKTNAIQDIRRAANDYIAELLPEGNQYKKILQRESLLFQAIKNISKKAPKEGSTALRRFGERHSTLKTGGAVLGGAALGGLGSSILYQRGN